MFLRILFLLGLLSVVKCESCKNDSCTAGNEELLYLLQLPHDNIDNMGIDTNLFQDTVSNIGCMKLGMSKQTKRAMKSITYKIKNWFKSLKHKNMNEFDEKFFLKYWQPSNKYFGYVNQMNADKPQKQESFFFPSSAMYNSTIYDFPFRNDSDIIECIEFMINKCREIFNKIWILSSFFDENDWELIIGDKPQFHVLFNYYTPDDNDDNIFGLNEHSDHGLITLLFAEKDGLQIKHNSKWYNIDVKNDFIINFGDILSISTNYKFKSAVHRVLKMTNTDRLSIGIFMDPDLEGNVYKYDEDAKNFTAHMTLDQFMQEYWENLYGNEN